MVATSFINDNLKRTLTSKADVGILDGIRNHKKKFEKKKREKKMKETYFI